MAQGSENPAALKTITLKQALDYAARKLKNRDFAEICLKKAVANGSLTVRSRTMLEEYASGGIRAFDKRKRELQIDVKEEGGFGSTIVNIKHLRNKPRGAQVLVNWAGGHLAWTSPPASIYFYIEGSSEPCSILATRVIMYNVELERQEVENVIMRLASGNAGADGQKIAKRTYRTDEDYRELLPKFYEWAENETLSSQYRVVRRSGTRAAIERAVRIALDNKVSPSTTKRIVGKLLALEVDAGSGRLARANDEMDQQ